MMLAFSMRETRARRLWLAASNAIFTIVLATLAGCTTSPDRFANPFLQLKAVSEDIASSGTTSVTVACPPPGKRIGGGYWVAKDNRNDGLLVRRSYPDDANGWNVEVENTSPVSNDLTVVTAYAYCLTRTDSVISVQRAGGVANLGDQKPLKTIIANCPEGTAATGGGFWIEGPLDKTDAIYNGGLMASEPSASGWKLVIGERFHEGLRLYASHVVCASAPFQPGDPVVSTYQNGPSQSSHDFGFSVACQEPDRFTTGGGFRFNDLYDQRHGAFASYAAAQWASWELNVHQGDDDAPRPSAVALCLRAP
jgi:hypothetical protein